MTDIRGLVAPAVLLACLATLYPVQRWIDSTTGARSTRDEYLYLTSGEDLKRLSLGYHQLLADIYWLRAVQYFGGKVQEDPSFMNERGDTLKLLYPLIDVATTLDPKFLPPYRFGGYFVHDYVDRELGLALLDKGIANNPQYWFLYQDKAILLWSQGDCEGAAKLFEQSARLPNAPEGAASLGPAVLAECGDIDAAAATYARLEEEFAEDELLRTFIARKRMGLEAQVEVEALRAAVQGFHVANGSYPPTLLAALRAGFLPKGARIRVDRAGQPVDPLGVAYQYEQQTGRISPGENGVILPVRIFTRKRAGAPPEQVPAGQPGAGPGSGG